MKSKQNTPPKARNSGFKGRKSGRFSNNCENFSLAQSTDFNNPMYQADNEALPQLRYGTHTQYCP